MTVVALCLLPLLGLLVYYPNRNSRFGATTRIERKPE